MVWVREINVRGPAGVVDVSDPAVMAAVEGAIDDMLATENVMRAYPKGPVQQTSLPSVPMQWTWQTLNAPVPELVTETVEGTWEGTGQRRGDVPILRPDGTLRESQIPDTIARRSDIPTVPEVPEVALPSRILSRNVPILAARLAAAKTANAALPIVFVGSSTTYSMPGFVVPLGQMLQETWRRDSYTAVQRDSDANFTAHTAPGVHVYNAGQSGTTATSFLSDAESDRIAALKPALIAIMVGSNDWRQGQAASTFKNNLTNRITYLQGKLTAPCQIVVVHQYERRDGTVGSEPWSAYRTALEEIAASFDNVVFHDIADAYYAVGVPTPDPLQLISSDNIHQTTAGYAFMAQVFAAFYFAT